ncbi:MAG: radical SAM protein [Chloroflexi bacterium]|nr:radical SAM protein [Chloroflexota bacterium]
MTAVAECPAIAPRLWVYTNFDCNLSCSYCVARSSPRAERRGLSMPSFRRLIDEAAEYGIRELFLTGGEPFLLPDIGDRLRYAAGRIQTTLLTNAMLFQGRRLDTLRSLVGLDIRFQVSLDGADRGTHDSYRGAGAWQRTLEGIRTLQELGMHVVIGSTETPVNCDQLDELRAFVRGLGVAPEDHFIRPLAKRGYSSEGIDVTAADLEPEVTVSVDGVYWHPLACDDDLLVTRRLFPFAEAMTRLHDMFHTILASGALPQKFR